MNWTILLNFFLVNVCLVFAAKSWEPLAKNSTSWFKKHESFLKHTRDERNETKVVFIGASITEFWQNEGKDIWKSYYVKKGAVDYGIGGDTTSNVLWRVDNHELNGLTPKVIVLQVGYNNFDFASNEDIARGVTEIIKQMRVKCPDSKIINIGIFPLKDKKKDLRVKPINLLLGKNADNKHIFFLDIGPHMVDSNGNQKEGVFREGLHLTAAGYQIWHDNMKVLFEKLYKE